MPPTDGTPDPFYEESTLMTLFRPVVATTARHRRHATAAAVAAVAGLTAGLLAPSAAHAAQIPKPRLSRVQLLMNSADPASATWSGDWSWTTPADIILANGYTGADLGCQDTDMLEFAWTTASRDGSSESPAVSDDDSTPAYDVYPWIAQTESIMGEYGTAAQADFMLGPDNAGVGNNYLDYGYSAFDVYTKASWPTVAWAFSGGSNVSAFNTTPAPAFFTAGNEVSLVLYCSPGTSADGAPLVRSDGSGHAVASWFHVILGDDPSTSDPLDSYTIVGDQTAPTVAAEADDVTRSSANLNATLTNDSGTTYGDASGTLQWYAGDIADATKTLGDPVTVTAGVAAAQAVDLSGYPAGSNQDFTAVFTPDSASQDLYTSSTSEALTLKVGADVAATTTTLAVSGSLTAGQTQKLTATVTPAAAGTVTFSDGGTSLGTAAVSGGTATLSKALAQGTHSITATFAPSSTTQFTGSTSTAQTVTIAAAPAPVVTVNAAAGGYGHAISVRVGATVGGDAATGSVTVTLDGKALATATLINGAATVTVPATTSAGSHTVAATYGGATGQRSVTIAKATTKATVTLPKKVTKAQTKKGQVAAKIRVTVPGTAVTATGAVTVKVGKKTVSAQLKGGAVTVKLPKKLTKSATKKLSVSVTYGGDRNLAASTTGATVAVKH